MNTVQKILDLGMCVGCGSCNICEHITFAVNAFGVPVPQIDDHCVHCGKCLKACIYDPDAEDE